MQITVKTTKKLTEGTNKYGAWVLYKIEAADGKIYTTLADGADVLTPGTVFEPAEVMLGEEKDGVQEFKFKKFTLVTSGVSAIPQQPEVAKALREATAEMNKPDPRGDPKNRSFALSYAKDWCAIKLQAGEDLKTADVIRVAKEFAKYLDNG